MSYKNKQLKKNEKDLQYFNMCPDYVSPRKTHAHVNLKEIQLRKKKDESINDRIRSSLNIVT